VPTPTEAKPGSAVSIAGALRRLKDAVAPAHIAAALGLPVGSSNAEVIAANLINKASMPDCDAATIKALLDRLAEIEPRQDVQINVVYEDAREKLLGPDTDADARRALTYWTERILASDCDDDLALGCGYVLAVLTGRKEQFENEIGRPGSTVIQ
jgi:hypothetical protein